MVRQQVRTPIAAAALMSGALVVVALLGSPMGAAGATHTLPASTLATGTTNSCPDQIAPPPPVDTSEKPAPGAPLPTPVPEPGTPLGGPRMAECGVILPANAPPLPTDLGCQSWLLEDLDTGAVLAAKDPHARQRPASLIKMLLALVVSRQLNADTVVTGTQDDANQEGTKVGVGPGGQYTVNLLVHALLMHSGNDAAHALAMQLGGMTEAVRKMNTLAAQLGALDTRAATPSGLDGPGMSTSAYDLALILRAVLGTPLLADALHTAQLPFPGFANKPGFVVDNDNDLLTKYPGDLGGKTGYTDDAQHTYANGAARNGHRVGLIMMRGTNHLPGMWKNANELMDYGFALETAGTAAVGELTQEATASKTLPAGAPVSVTVPNSVPGAARPAGAPTAGMSTFGNVGGPLTALTVVAVAGVGALYWRRRKAKLARLARDRERANAITVVNPAVPGPTGGPKPASSRPAPPPPAGAAKPPPTRSAGPPPSSAPPSRRPAPPTPPAAPPSRRPASPEWPT